MYPKNGLIVEVALGESSGRYSDMSGVTELRKLSSSQLGDALKKIYGMIEQSGQSEFKAEKKRYWMEREMYE